MFGDIGPGEVILILIVLIVVFGPKRIPDLAGSLGKGVRQFRRSLQGLDDDASVATQAQSQAPSLPPPPQAVAAPQAPVQTDDAAAQDGGPDRAQEPSFETAAPPADEREDVA